jgi:thioredoxin reductase (NADPH)
MEIEYNYDYFVIGGGSGGLASASAAAEHGAKVGLADFVKPSPLGTKWGLGGTCVNVGCIPKKLFHYIGLLGEARDDLNEVGWKVDPDIKHNWEVAHEKVTDHIKSINFGYRKKLNTEKIAYHNKLARLLDKHTVELTDAKGKVETVTAKYILLATGGRPTDPGIPGKEHSISSDDIFWMAKPPGRTLCVGASYISLECAGFLHGMGFDVTVMVRSIFLRGFDQQLANKVGEGMANQGVKFIRKAVPISITLNNEGQKVVRYKQGEDEIEDVYDTVLFAIGRSADTKGLNLEAVGVETASNGKVKAKDNDQTTVENIFAIGDCCHGRIELTPTAIMAGRLLAARLFKGATREMSYKYVPTTVFTPIEYGCCGYSEEDARETFGNDNIVAYGSIYKPPEWSMNYNRQTKTYAKVVVNKADSNKVVGFHYFGPNAGEVTQGFAVAILKGITKEDLDLTVGIHPTMAEVLFC